jgi:hypothetical protein
MAQSISGKLHLISKKTVEKQATKQFFIQILQFFKNKFKNPTHKKLFKKISA